MIAWIRTLLFKGALLHGSVFAATFLAVLSFVYYAPMTRTFWSVLTPHFAQDQRYQLHSLFAPDQGRAWPLLLVGDARFIADLPSSLRQTPGAETIVINHYDPDDLGLVIRGLNIGARYTSSKSCTLIVQVSPLFSLRAKTAGEPQDYRILRAAHSGIVVKHRVETFFMIFKKWAEVDATMPALERDAGRPERMVGLARYSDPTAENWDIAFADVGRYKKPIIGVLDTRGTDWGADSDLVETTRQRLDTLAAEHPNFSWLAMDDIANLYLPGAEAGCPP